MSERADQAAATLGPVLAELDLPVLLPGDTVADDVREMLFAGAGISLRKGSTMLYTDNGEPIDLPFSDAMKRVEQIRFGDGGEISDDVVTRDGVPIRVFTGYLGVDLSTCGPVPMVWETLVFIGDDILGRILEPWRYMTRAAAHAGHDRVVEAVHQAVRVT